MVTRLCAILAVATLALLTFTMSPARATVVLGYPFLGHQYPTPAQGAYDKEPSTIQIGTVRHSYWCGYGGLLSADGQPTANLYYSAYDVATDTQTAPQDVLGPSTDSAAWDSADVCDPSVVSGNFSYNGIRYTTAVYFSGTSVAGGAGRTLGVAFTNDWVTFTRVTEPVLTSTCSAGPGLGTPATQVGTDGSRVTLFYTDDRSGCGLPTEFEAASSQDAVDFTAPAGVTTLGLIGNGAPSSADLGYDRQTDQWYLAADFSGQTSRDYEPGRSYSFGLYRISAGMLFTSTASWTLLRTVDTETTGYEINFSPGITRDGSGDVNVAGIYPDIQIAYTVGNPRTVVNADTAQDISFINPQTWDITQVTWRPGKTLLDLNRYYSPALERSVSSTGWVDETTFHLEATAGLGALYETPTGAATTAVYGCRSRTGYDYFDSTGSDCEGQKILGIEGYGYPPGSGGARRIPLYRCDTGIFHFLSRHRNCEGYTSEGLLAYSKKRP